LSNKLTHNALTHTQQFYGPLDFVRDYPGKINNALGYDLNKKIFTYKDVGHAYMSPLLAMPLSLLKVDCLTSSEGFLV